MAEQEPITIERMAPTGGATHELASQDVLDRITAEVGPKQQMISLAHYLKEIGHKARGAGNGTLNSHFEEFIVREDGDIKVTSLAELQQKLAEAGVTVEILGVESVGNPFQKVSAKVQGFNPENPQSGFERPTVAEGPHMVLAITAKDKEGKLHLFRTIQYRTGEAIIDTPRGFADAQSREDGTQLYDLEKAGERVPVNVGRVVGEEAGEVLKIKKIIYLGSPRVNSSFVTSKSALFAVEVDYDHFVKASKVVSEEEYARRKEAFEHEGLTGAILDMDMAQYANYKRDSRIARDMAADAPADIMVIDWLDKQLTIAQAVVSERHNMLKRFGEVFKKFKKSDPEGYKTAWLQTMKELNVSA